MYTTVSHRAYHAVGNSDFGRNRQSSRQNLLVPPVEDKLRKGPSGGTTLASMKPRVKSDSWSKIPVSGYAMGRRGRQENIRCLVTIIDSLSHSYLPLCICSSRRLSMSGLPTSPKCRSSSSFKASSTRTARRCTLWCVFITRVQRFRRKRPSWGRGIDRLVFLEHATRLPGV